MIRKFWLIGLLVLLAFSQIANAADVAKLTKLANKGSPAAMILLGDIYAAGVETPKSNAQSLKWYKKAADTGSVFGMTNLARIYFFGLLNVPRDHTLSAYWFKKAAEKGYGRAQRHLAMMYFTAQGLPQDNLQAYAWWGLAAASGDHLAQQYQRIVRDMMTPDAIRRANERVLLYERLYGYAYQD